MQALWFARSHLFIMTKKTCYPWGDKITGNPVFFIMAHENPNWPEANLLAIYKCVLGIEHGTTENMQIQSAVKAGLN